MPLLAAARFLGVHKLPYRDQWALRALMKDETPLQDSELLSPHQLAPHMPRLSSPRAEEVTQALTRVIGIGSEGSERHCDHEV
jgi:hypothetical protein